MRTYEELLAAQTELAHFNTKHDAKGRFAKKNGGTATFPKQPPKGTTEALLRLYGMSTSKIPRESFRYNGDPRPVTDSSSGGYSKSDRKRIRSDIVAQMTSSMLSQLHAVDSDVYRKYGSNLISVTSNNTTDPNLNRNNIKHAMTKELLAAYKGRVVSPALRIKDETDEAEVEQLIRDAVEKLVEQEIAKRGRSTMSSLMNKEKAEATKAEGRKSAMITLKDRINAAYKEASNAYANRKTASVNTLKHNLSIIANKSKAEVSNLTAKGKSFISKAFAKFS